MRNLQVFFYAALSVFLMTAGIPNETIFFGMPLSGLVSLIPLYLALSRCTSYRQAGCATSLFSGTVHLASSFWLANFQEYAIFTIGATTLYYYITGFLTGLILYIPFSFTSAPEKRLNEDAGLHPFNCFIRILFFGASWTVFEWIKSNGFLAYPWGTVILTAWKWKLLTQVASLTGSWGISFLFPLFAATASEIIVRPIRISLRTDHPVNRSLQPVCNAALFTASLFALTLIYGTYEYLKPRTPVKTLNTVLVQHNGDSWEDSEEQCLMTAQRLTREAIKASDASPDLVLWSEGVLTYPLPHNWWYYDMIPEDESLIESIQETGVPYIIGAPYVMDESGTQFGNCAVLISPEADILDYYAKIHLVPFAEGIPFADKIWMQKFMQLIAGFSHGWKAGEEFKTFTVQGSAPVTVSSPVCFEDAFPSVCRNLFLAGSEVFLNITNDSWSLKKSSEYQHYVIASYRAIEYRTTLVRSTNGGYTSVTDPAGKITVDLPPFEEASVLTEVPVYERELTVYALLGDWLPLLCGCMMLLAFLYFIKSLHFKTNH